MTSQSSILARPIADLSLDELLAACRQAHGQGQDAFDCLGTQQDMGANTTGEAELIIASGYQGVLLDGLPDDQITQEEYDAFDTADMRDDLRIAAFVEGWRYAVRQHARQAAANVAVWQQAQ